MRSNKSMIRSITSADNDRIKLSVHYVVIVIQFYKLNTTLAFKTTKDSARQVS